MPAARRTAHTGRAHVTAIAVKNVELSATTTALVKQEFD